MQKPNFKAMKNSNQHVSRAHIFAYKPDENHYDHYKNSVERKEYGKNLKFDWEIINGTHIRFNRKI